MAISQRGREYDTNVGQCAPAHVAPPIVIIISARVHYMQHIYSHSFRNIPTVLGRIPTVLGIFPVPTVLEIFFIFLMIKHINRHFLNWSIEAIIPTVLEIFVILLISKLKKKRKKMLENARLFELRNLSTIET